ncbi:DUF4145 domain-containing protein [Pseudomonas sp. BC115LW]|uniref:DUF4145 domain-containing protein n=1 Tax=Pseudomonas sp. BC115LW TaxID=2683267 RepID=UPI001411C77F|nr:DUF4145 domain-containing protein [Pseudomonas sp. BC115LW]NBB32968.1 DUF4145 domain-containing protein [Pseudomonas sp. BC115LW]
MSSTSIVMNDCRTCYRSTRHSISAEITDRVKEEWSDELHSWRVVRCLGCHTYSFQKKYEDFDEIEEGADGELKHAVSFAVYPSVIKNHRGLSYTYFLPPLIRTIYIQTVTALSQNANVLASIGLRACIEAVCNSLDISGSNLQRRIDQLFKAGYVSNGDKKRLHAIRFLGNDAAHEIKQPKSLDIMIALEIVEHLLNTVFILEQRASGLETIAESYDDFIKLLKNCASEHKSGTSINLLGLLGPRRRLIAASLDTFEMQLLSEIEAGDLIFLKKASTQNAEEIKVQLYDVDQNALWDEDIPF